MYNIIQILYSEKMKVHLQPFNRKKEKIQTTILQNLKQQKRLNPSKKS